MNSAKDNIKQAWFLRKALYLVTAVVMFVLSVFGIVTVEASEQAVTQVVEVGTPIISMIVAGIAAKKTTADSDNTISATLVNQRMEAIENAVMSPSNFPVETVEVSEPVVDEEIYVLPVYKGESTAN